MTKRDVSQVLALFLHPSTEPRIRRYSSEVDGKLVTGERVDSDAFIAALKDMIHD